MNKKLFLVFIGLFLVTNLTKAADDICKAATDSAEAHSKRNDFAFYYQSKVNANLYNFIQINNERYKRTPVRISLSANDTSKISKNKILKAIYDKSSDVAHPLDTSNEYKRCFNKAFQLKLDSLFKCDFFRKADSIMMDFDKTGKGYSGVDFPGGAIALKSFFDKNLELPKSALPNDSAKILRVFYSFFVDEEGKISEISLVKSNCKVCEELVLEAIKKMPAFIPAKDGGKPKKVKYILPYYKPLFIRK
jgi:hypothetical protein